MQQASDEAHTCVDHGCWFQSINQSILHLRFGIILLTLCALINLTHLVIVLMQKLL